MAKRQMVMASVAFVLLLSVTVLPAQGAQEYVRSVEQQGEVAEAVAAPTSIEEGILFMREEEKLARDVYFALYERWGIRTFSNIARSEQQHMDAVAALMKSKGIADPVATSPVGVFTNATIAALYAELISLGMQSPMDALTVGAIIEDMDIADLESLLGETDDPDTVRVYTALLRGSENHMRSFAGLLKRFGAPYEARYITGERLQEILGTR